MKLYVGNLSYEVTEEDLRQAFEPFGQIESAVIIKDRLAVNPKDLDSWSSLPKRMGSRPSTA